jgi:hypothetical protein
MNRRFMCLILAVLLACLGAYGVALAVGGQDVAWHVISGGGGRNGDGGHVLESSIGLPIAGYASTGDRSLCAGYWCGVTWPTARRLFYMPIIVADRQQP